MVGGVRKIEIVTNLKHSSELAGKSKKIKTSSHTPKLDLHKRKMIELWKLQTLGK
jgi:hypothetical protein